MSENIQTAFIGHVTRLTDKIDSYIHEPEKHEEVICLSDQLTVIFEKLKEVNDQFTSDRKSREHRERKWNLL